MTITMGSLFSGIGALEYGFGEGLKAGGYPSRVAFQIEQNNYCRRVLAKHFPDAERFKNVKNSGGANLPKVSGLIGGFPCTNLSVAGDGTGLKGKKSGLWREFARIICEIRPRFVVIENVPALANRGLDIVLGDLGRAGYDAEWQTLSAGLHCGAPHLRKRLFIIAHLPNANHAGRREQRRPVAGPAKHPTPQLCSGWATEPPVLRVANGYPGRVDEIRALGNAVVPAQAALVGYRVAQLITQGVIQIPGLKEDSCCK